VSSNDEIDCSNSESPVALSTPTSLPNSARLPSKVEREIDTFGAQSAENSTPTAPPTPAAVSLFDLAVLLSTTR
jgi:hypothetical protein